MRTTLVAGLLFALVLPGCLDGGEITGFGGGGSTNDGDGTNTGGGGGGGSGSTTTPTPRIDATLDKNTVMTELGKTETIMVTITGANGFSGPVSITPSVMEGTTAVTDWTVTATPPNVDLPANGTATVELAIKIPTDSVATTPTLKLDLGGSAPMSVSSAFNVAKKVTINIPAGTGTGVPHAGLPLNQPLRIRAGTMVVFHNGDTIQHVIHASGGVNHENLTGGMPGSDYMVTPTADATWYCHNHEGGTQSRAINL